MSSLKLLISFFTTLIAYPVINHLGACYLKFLSELIGQFESLRIISKYVIYFSTFSTYDVVVGFHSTAIVLPFRVNYDLPDLPHILQCLKGIVHRCYRYGRAILFQGHVYIFSGRMPFFFL